MSRNKLAHQKTYIICVIIMIRMLFRRQKTVQIEKQKEEETPESGADIESTIEEVAKEARKKKRILGKEKIKEKPVVEPYDPEKHGELVTARSYEGYKEVDRYWVYEPYVFVSILYNEDENDYLYAVNEPELNPVEVEIKSELEEKLRDVLIFEDIEDYEHKEDVLKNAVDRLLKDFRIKIEPISYYKILYYLIRDFVEYGRITPLMKDSLIEDISCNGHNVPVYLFHRNYTNVATNIVFENEEELNSYVINLAQKCGKHISIAEPMIDASLPDGSRIQMTLGREVTSHGSTFTIRKFRDEPITPVHLILWRTFSSEEMAYLWLCIENNKSLIFAGGTASGKTTSMNAVSLFIPRKAKIVSIEDTRELMLPHENWIPATTRDAFQGEVGKIDMYDLLRAALRQRPEYILVGEVRGKEALTLFQAMSTGHTTYSTLHADSVSGAIHRLENPPINVPRPMIEALDIVSIQAQTYVEGKRVRRNIELTEIVDLDPHTKMLRTSTVFAWDSVRDEHKMVGNSKALEEIRVHRGWSAKELDEELERRRKILEYLAEHDIKDYRRVSAVVHAYQSKPEKVLDQLGIA